MLVPEGPDGKVLLPNTVYPVGPCSKTPARPRYRISGKRSPHFVVRSLQAVPFVGAPAHSDSRFSPGGECGDLDSLNFEVESGGEFSDHAHEVQQVEGIEQAGQSWRGVGFLGEFRAAMMKSDSRSILYSGALPTPEECLLVLEECFGVVKGEEGSFEEREVDLLLGLGPGRQGGRVTFETLRAPHLTSWLNGLVQGRAEGLRWTTLHLLRNPSEGSLGSGWEASVGEVFLMTLGRFRGGGLWVEDDQGWGYAVRCDSKGNRRVGRVLDVSREPVRFDGTLGHAIEPWEGDLWILKAFVAPRLSHLDEGARLKMRELGFPDEVSPGFSGEARDFETTVCADIEPISVGEPAQCAVSAFDKEGGRNPEGSIMKETWEVLFPHQLVQPEWLERALCCHEASLYLCKQWSQELSGDYLDPQGLAIAARELRTAMKELEWWECVLRANQPPSDSSPLIRSLQSEVPLNASEAPAVEQFLQTRTVSLEEARGELESWRQPAMDELEALEVTTGAVERVTSQEVERWVQQGRKVVQVPGKAVLTRKSGVGKRRLRAVCCGNFVPPSEFNATREDLYAGGVDALTFRVVLSYVAQFPQWTACSLDIKTAFLNAPVRGSDQVEGSSDPVIVVRPPFILVQLGLLQSCHRWRVRRALYGLQTSPRDWAEHRDKVLRGMAVDAPIRAKLVQSAADDSLWFLKSDAKPIEAMLVVYVDDIAVFGPEEVLASLVKEVQKVWTISGPHYVKPDEPLSFCGMELARTLLGWRISQSRYLRELLSRYGVVGVASSPMNKFSEPSEETPTPERVKEAQAITGALLWSVTRSRPDLMYTTSKMGQYATKAPGQVVEWGMQALKYVATTLDLGLEFLANPGPAFGSHSQLSVPRLPGYLEIYSDASHAPDGGRSTQSTMVCWRGSLICWETSRQPFVTLSSAEAELISMVHSIQVSESICPLIEEILEEDVVTSLLGDNSAALAAFNPGAGSWRNRHLRMRANAGRERIAAGTLSTSYVPGELQVADVGTKALPGSKLLALLELVNVRGPPGGGPVPVVAKCLCRFSKACLSEAANVSPATMLVLAMLTLPGRVSGNAETSRMLSTTWLVHGVGMVMAQPVDRLEWYVSWMYLVVLGLFMIAVALGVWMACVNGVRPLIVPPGEYVESLEGVESVEEHEDGSGSSNAGGQEIEQWHLEEFSQSASLQGPCLFPIVGRVDPRSSWVPSHYLRRLLSIRGDVVLLHVGLEDVGIWRLRVLARSFRYGVAFAFERARGLGPLRRPGGAGEVYDIAEVELLPPVSSQGSGLPPGSSQGSGLPPGSSQGSVLPPGSSQGSVLPPGSSQGSGLPPGSSQGSGLPPGSSQGSGLPPGSSQGSGVLLESSVYQAVLPQSVTSGMGEVPSLALGMEAGLEYSGLELASDSSGSGVTDDSEIDRVRHVLPEELPVQVPVGWGNMGVGEDGLLGDSDEESSTTEAGTQQTPLMSDDSSVAGTSRQEQTSQGPVNPPNSVAYRAIDGGLIVIHLDDELFIPLPGWSLEEVGSIVEGIRVGNWSLFHQVMTLGSTQIDYQVGPIAEGNRGLPSGSISYGTSEGEELNVPDWDGRRR